MDGGNSNDRLIGGAGDDTYVASPGFDSIEWDSGGSDVLMLPAGYDSGDLTFIRKGDHLEIRVAGLGQVEIQGQLYSAGGYAVETLSFNGASTMTLTSAQIETVGTAGNDNLTGITVGASTSDIMDGREGNDDLAGWAGDDVYYFSIGDDTVQETSGSETIRFREAWDTGDIEIYRSGEFLILEDQNGNSMKCYAHFTTDSGGDNSATRIEQIVFSDTTTWTLSGMEIETRGTSSGDSIHGAVGGDASSADTIYGLGGYDSISSGAGNDTLYGGDGGDSLYGGSGADTFVLETASAFNNRDDVGDFNAGDGDVIDLTDILGAVYDPVTEAITDFVSISVVSGSSIISVDRDGTGGTYSMAEVVRLYGTTGLGTAENMETNGNLIAA